MTKFLVNISQFEFLVMAEKNIFVYKHFLSLKFQILVYFLQKKLPPFPSLKKVIPSFPATLL